MLHIRFLSSITKACYSCPSNAFAMCLSDIALNALQKDDPSTAVIGEEAFNNSINHQWSSFLCLLSLSSVLKERKKPLFVLTRKEN
jgi:hypothetical protein